MINFIDDYNISIENLFTIDDYANVEDCRIKTTKSKEPEVYLYMKSPAPEVNYPKIHSLKINKKIELIGPFRLQSSYCKFTVPVSKIKADKLKIEDMLNNVKSPEQEKELKESYESITNILEYVKSETR